MKITKILTLALVLVLVGVLAVGCKEEAATTTTKTLTATIQKGSLSESITGTGNLAYSNVEKLAFEMAGTVEEVLVSAGNTVKKGQELVKLDTSVWEDQIKTLEKAITTAQRTLQTKQRAQVTAERQVTAKELSVRSAELDLQTAEGNLTNIPEVQTAQNTIDTIDLNIKIAKANWLEAGAAENTPAVTYYMNLIDELQKSRTAAQKVLDGIISDNSLSLSSADLNNLTAKIARYQLQLEQSQRSLEDAKLAVEDANVAVEDAKTAVSDAEQAVKDAQDALAEVKDLSPIITAPFDGYITKINIVGGDTVQKGTVAIQIADPTQFKANIMVTENDIFSVKLGGTATVSLDALSDLAYPAEITEIAPTATVSSGVVNYSVTVQLTSLQPITARSSTSSQTSAQLPGGTTSSTTLPTGTRPTAFPTGTFPTGTPPTTLPQGTTGTTQTPTGITGDTTAATAPTTSAASTMTLKDGLSATVEIISKQVSNVLIIPSKAITRKVQVYTVQVVSGTTTETRTVKIGMTDGTNTEITEGLSEGETVTYTVSSSSTSSSSTNSNNRQGVIFGGPGGF
ncbi:MAG: efflux RND transporter periplasmic adaptor subunit [Dehalococcoidales bacterium]|nr:efflux RND transporter periplasmic adaptor subunit [Dehalococcoidales bacterium]